MAPIQLLPVIDDATVSCLVYCIVDAGGAEPRPSPLFAGYPAPSIKVRAGGLGVVMSRECKGDSAPDTARLLAYARVIESYNRERSVIPMRYGCRVAGASDARRLLQSRRPEFLGLLADLDGRIEMSARVLLKPSPAHGKCACRETRTGPGRDYLAQRAEYYARRSQLDERCEEICARLRELARGTFVRWTSEVKAAGLDTVIAIHFLVPRAGVDNFVAALRGRNLLLDSQLSVTGPWPPYNFVSAPVA